MQQTDSSSTGEAGTPSLFVLIQTMGIYVSPFSAYLQLHPSNLRSSTEKNWKHKQLFWPIYALLRLLERVIGLLFDALLHCRIQLVKM